MIAQELLARWELAYQLYRDADKARSSGDVDPLHVAQLVAMASWQVALAWRDIAGAPGLPHWLTAALDAAAVSFEHQAREWNSRRFEQRPGE